MFGAGGFGEGYSSVLVLDVLAQVECDEFFAFPFAEADGVGYFMGGGSVPSLNGLVVTMVSEDSCQSGSDLRGISMLENLLTMFLW